MGRLGTFLVCLLPLFTVAEVFKGNVDVEANQPDMFEFLGKFCVDKDETSETTYPGTANVLLTGNPAMVNSANMPAGFKILLYDDQDESWPAVYHNDDMSCMEKTSKAKGASSVVWANGEFTTLKWITQHVRPRFWYVVLANCNMPAHAASVEINYEVHFLNKQSASWNQEFGVNMWGMLPVYAVFISLYTAFVIIHGYGIKMQIDRDQEAGAGISIHPLVKLFTCILLIQYFSVFFEAAHIFSFAADGMGLPMFNALGDVTDAAARVLFILLLMLLAQGWAISNNTLTGKSFILYTVGGFSIVYILSLLWEAYETSADPASTSISLAEFLLYCILLVAWPVFGGWFMYTIRQSYEDEYKPKKKSLYFRLACIFTPWFMTIPVTIILSEFMDPWVRDKCVETFALSSSTLSYGVMAYLLWYTRAEHYFEMNLPDVSKGAIEEDDQL